MSQARPDPAADRPSPEWVERPERSNLSTIRFIVWVALTLGRPVARGLLYPITLYFLVFAPRARAASRAYLGKALGRRPALRDLFRHFHTFAATILDRVYFLNDRGGPFDVRVHGEEIVDALLAREAGCFLLGAHMGSFEVVRAVGRKARALRVGMLMYEDNARRLNTVLDAINPRLAMNVIGLGRLDSMLKLEQALDRGEFVGMLGDRSLVGEGTLACPFFGEPARFPLGPFRLGHLLQRPIVLMFGIYRGGHRYDIYFEALATAGEADGADTEAALRHYVARLEHYCRLAPYNWFNFYDFWR